MKTNQKGFTLIEIIVSIAIASIVLLIIGQIIISSSLFMGTTVRTDEYKRKTDEIVSLVREEVQYATDVRFVKEDSQYVPDYENDSKWHYLYVKDGMLYRDGKKILSDGYYEDQTISIYIRGYKDNNHRMDIQYSLLDYNKEKVYGLKDTIMLLNLSLSNEMASKAFITNTNEYELSNNGYWLFYIKKVNNVETPVDPIPDISGTVADELNCKNSSNVSIWKNGEKYSAGDFIFYNEHWYRAIHDIGNSSKPDENKQGNWKLIEAYWSSNSSYLKGDVVIESVGSVKYYKCLKAYDGTDKPDVKLSNNNYWKLLSSEEIEIVKKEHSNPSFCNSKLCSFKKLKTVNDELCERDSVVSIPSPSSSKPTDLTNNKGDWDKNSILADANLRMYYKGDFVEYNGTVWKCVSEHADLSATQKPGVGYLWKKIQKEYDDYSVYEKDDVVLYELNNKYYLSLTGANVWKPTERSVWVEVIANDTGNGWVEVK